MVLTLENMVEALAQHVAQSDQQTLPQARSTVRRWVSAALREYRAAHMPYGGTVTGFLIWLGERRLALAA